MARAYSPGGVRNFLGFAFGVFGKRNAAAAVVATEVAIANPTPGPSGGKVIPLGACFCSKPRSGMKNEHRYYWRILPHALSVQRHLQRIRVPRKDFHTAKGRP